MPPLDTPTRDELRIQIAAFQAARMEVWEPFAKTLQRVFSDACRPHLPSAIVQTRAKVVSSFAEKCIRKWDRYKDPVNQLTDLCGARIIVQLLDQVDAVRSYVRANFAILEEDDKTRSLGDDQFGYRDLHFLIRLRPEQAQKIGFTDSEIDQFRGRTAELQVRSLVQHAWSDILHDRVYKTPLGLPADLHRTTGLLAAIMEEGDLNFQRLSREIDQRSANYSSYASKSEVEDEVQIQELTLIGEEDRAKRAETALSLSRLKVAAGRYEEAVDLLSPYEDLPIGTNPGLLLELGFAKCKSHSPQGKATESYRNGQRMMESVFEFAKAPDFSSVPDLVGLKALWVKSATRLALSYEFLEGKTATARDYYRTALILEPNNPYLLANALGFEACFDPSGSVIACMRGSIENGIATCEEHAKLGIELPYAFLTGGRLHLLLGKPTEALGWYARGLRYLSGSECLAPVSVLNEEISWLRRLADGRANRAPYDWIERLIELTRSTQKGDIDHQNDKRILIVAGGAGSLSMETANDYRESLAAAAEVFRGTMISGGTQSGVPGLVGEIAAHLKADGGRSYDLVGYIPKSLPHDTPKDENYDSFVIGDEPDFSPGQVLQMWKNIVGDGVNPTSVRVIGLGGGSISGFEYRVALAMGAQVALFEGGGGESDAILNDPFWNGERTLFPLPNDPAVARAFATSPAPPFTEAEIDSMAQAAHESYVEKRSGSLPDGLRPWVELEETYKKANAEQIRFMLEILSEFGFSVEKAAEKRSGSFDFLREAPIEEMARREHGRWVIDRLKDGWRPGIERNDEKKIHPDLISWKSLRDDIKELDIDAIKAWPDILMRKGWEIVTTPPK